MDYAFSINKITKPTHMELAVKSSLQQTHFVQIESVIHGHLLSLNGSSKNTTVDPVRLQSSAQSIHILAVVERLDTFRIEETNGGKKRLTDIAKLDLEIIITSFKIDSDDSI